MVACKFIIPPANFALSYQIRQYQILFRDSNFDNTKFDVSTLNSIRLNSIPCSQIRLHQILCRAPISITLNSMQQNLSLRTQNCKSNNFKSWYPVRPGCAWKDSREVLGTSFRFGPTSEILENIQYGGSSVVKTDSQRSRFISREAWFRVLLTRIAFIVTFEEFLVLYSKQSIYKCLIS